MRWVRMGVCVCAGIGFITTYCMYVFDRAIL